MAFNQPESGIPRRKLTFLTFLCSSRARSVLPAFAAFVSSAHDPPANSQESGFAPTSDTREEEDSWSFTPRRGGFLVPNTVTGRHPGPIPDKTVIFLTFASFLPLRTLFATFVDSGLIIGGVGLVLHIYSRIFQVIPARSRRQESHFVTFWSFLPLSDIPGIDPIPRQELPPFSTRAGTGLLAASGVTELTGINPREGE